MKLKQSIAVRSVALEDPIASIPTQGALDLHVGRSLLSIPFNKHSARKLLTRIDEIYDLFTDLEIEAKEMKENGDDTFNSYIPAVQFYDCYAINEGTVTTCIKIVCDPNRWQSVTEAKATITLTHGALQAEGDTLVTKFRGDIERYLKI